jgi:hypothetical protein
VIISSFSDRRATVADSQRALAGELDVKTRLTETATDTARRVTDVAVHAKHQATHAITPAAIRSALPVWAIGDHAPVITLAM